MFNQKRKRIKEYNLLREKRNHGSFCNAPNVALRFHRNGGVQVCCHHIDYYFLKGKSLKDVWFGAELLEMRKRMKKFDIPDSCNFCASAFYTKNYSNVGALSFDYLQPNENGYPVLMDFSLENTCNLSCIMCDASLSSSIQADKHIKKTYRNEYYNEKFIEELKEFYPHLTTTVFTGGEPFLINLYYDIWRDLLEINPDVVINITTNGTVYNQKIENVLNQGKFNITVSLDSLIPEKYNQIRKKADFYQTMANVEQFAKYCKKANTIFTITVCPMIINQDDIPDVVNMCNENGWNFTYNTVLKPWSQALWSLDSESINRLIQYYRHYEFVENDENSFANIEKFQSLIKLLDDWKIKAEKFEKSGLETKELKQIRENAINLIDKTIHTQNGISVDKKNVDIIINKMPDILICEKFLDYLDSQNPQIIAHEFMENDLDTIVDHLCIVAFNL